MATGYILVFVYRRGRLNLPDSVRMVYLWMHYFQGRDRWFGRIQSAPTVDAYICSARMMAFFRAPSLLFTSCNSYSSLLFATMPPPA